LQRGFATEQSERAGAAVPQWTDVYGQIKAPREVSASLQSRLDGLGTRKENYFGYKDQCWLDAANEEIALSNGWGFVEEALGESARLTAELESGRPAKLDNPSLRTVAALRPDIAASLGVIRRDARFAYCPQAQREVACMEVKLMHAGHDAWARNFDAAQEKVDAVERVMSDARAHLDGCAVPRPPVAAVSLPPKIALSADALFPFDRGDIESITENGRAKLDAVIADAKRAGDVSGIAISGFTDRLGSLAYNRALSQRRATSVQRYLQDHGVTVPIQARGYGPASPGAQCTMSNHRALVDCLAGDRRVELQFTRRGETPSSGE
jgi:outer membrane protein OmpA-like peptidoglycan-associated protein